MEITEPEAGHEDAFAAEVGDVVTRSMRASYSVSPEEIDALVGQLFDEESVAERLDREETRFLAVYLEDELVGFAEGHTGESGDTPAIHWIHVDPPARGEGAGTELMDRLRERLGDGDAADVRMRVLDDNREGEPFVERFDMGVVDTDTIEVDGTTHQVEVYAASASEEDGVDTTDAGTESGTDVDGESIDTQDPDPSDVPDEVETPEGTLPVSQEEVLSGSNGPFLVVCEDDDCGDAAGYHCTNCGTFTQAVDSMGRIDCEVCSNVHRPDDWDGSYL